MRIAKSSGLGISTETARLASFRALHSLRNGGKVHSPLVSGPHGRRSEAHERSHSHLRLSRGGPRRQSAAFHCKSASKRVGAHQAATAAAEQSGSSGDETPTPRVQGHPKRRTGHGGGSGPDASAKTGREALRLDHQREKCEIDGEKDSGLGESARGAQVRDWRYHDHGVRHAQCGQVDDLERLARRRPRGLGHLEQAGRRHRRLGWGDAPSAALLRGHQSAHVHGRHAGHLRTSHRGRRHGHQTRHARLRAGAHHAPRAAVAGDSERPQ
mmetsp:Transcript_11172/g.41717  ORF Transcript_11172/g.41717 Transcript_11172/m.41717 type:complete len:270 (+) Transcript_11172:68-877(+)